MHLMQQELLGATIILLLATLVFIKRFSTGSILEKPEPKLLLWLVNTFNLFFLLVANPVAAVLLLTGRLERTDPTFLPIGSGSLLMAIEILGLVVYLGGFLLMGWALLTLGKNYQLGGGQPRATDALIQRGPYAIVRHPMYTAALCIALGLSFLIQSLVCLTAFAIYVVLMFLFIPGEEEALLKAYGEQYGVYQQRVGRLLPHAF